MKLIDTLPPPIIICGLAFGDEGKGSITDALVRRLGARTVVRYNGGPQAGHNVVAPDGTWHCFAQFGAGMLAPNVRTLLSRHMLVELENMEAEADALGAKGVSAPRKRMFLDPACLIITPMQKFVGRMREVARRPSPNGSCGMGVGETIRDAEIHVGLTVKDILSGRPGLETLREIAERKLGEAASILDGAPSDEMRSIFGQMAERSDAEVLYGCYRKMLESVMVTYSPCDFLRQELATGPVVFEGAQGALLDRCRGFLPYVTKSDTSCANALSLLRDAGSPRKAYKLGIMRAYATRHGAGPFPTEDERLRARFDDGLNRQNRWQGKFRIGWLDLPALRYGIALNEGVDGLAVTGLDRLSGLQTIRVCASYDKPIGPSSSGCRPLDWIELPGWQAEISGTTRYRDLPKNARKFLRFLESQDGLGVGIAIVSVGPRSDQKLFLL